jgi:hypothetical protein
MHTHAQVGRLPTIASLVEGSVVHDKGVAVIGGAKWLKNIRVRLTA